jgi:hypothetical protein
MSKSEPKSEPELCGVRIDNIAGRYKRAPHFFTLGGMTMDGVGDFPMPRELTLAGQPG